MLKTGIENLKDGMKVVVEDMSKIAGGVVAGESGEVLTLRKGVEKHFPEAWFLVGSLESKYILLMDYEYKYVKVISEGEDMEDFKVGDVVEIIAENDPYGFIGDHDIKLGTKVTLLHHDPSDNTFLVEYEEGWEVWVEPQAMKKVEDLANCDNLVEKYPEGTLLKCLVDDLDWYREGEVYEVGYCKIFSSYYGVLDQDGDVLYEATIYDFIHEESGGFDPTQWEVVESEEVKVEEPKHEPKFKVGDLVVRARETENLYTFYPAGTVMEVISVEPTGSYRCVGCTPHSKAERQYVEEKELELASIEDIKKLTQEFVEKSKEDNSEEAPDLTYILTDVHNQIEQIRRMCTALDYKVALTLAELDVK